MPQFEKNVYDYYSKRTLYFTLPLVNKRFALSLSISNAKDDYWDGQFAGICRNENPIAKGYSAWIREFNFTFGWTL